jgi:hypothetical protein
LRLALRLFGGGLGRLVKQLHHLARSLRLRALASLNLVGRQRLCENNVSLVLVSLDPSCATTAAAGRRHGAPRAKAAEAQAATGEGGNEL